MNKKGMSLVTLSLTLIAIIGVMYACVIGITKTNLVKSLEKTGQSMDLLSVQEMANTAYASIYFDNLTQGIRRELTPLEIRTRMQRNGTGNIDLSKYNITVENGSVFVTPKEEK